MGAQADNLFYLDPHHSRPAIPLRPPPPSQSNRETTPESDRDNSPKDRPSPTSQRPPNSPTSVRTGSSAFSYHAPLSPSPLQHEFSTSSSNAGSSSSSNFHNPRASRSPSIKQHSRFRSPSQSHSQPASDAMDVRELSGLDPVQEHYVTAYNAAELKTYHCERVRKMPLSGLDPSMLIGFLCKDETDWWDFRRRVGDVSCLSSWFAITHG